MFGPAAVAGYFSCPAAACCLFSSAGSSWCFLAGLCLAFEEPYVPSFWSQFGPPFDIISKVFFTHCLRSSKLVV